MAKKTPSGDSHRMPQPSSAVDAPGVPSSWLSLHRFRQQISRKTTDGNSYAGNHCRDDKTITKRSSSEDGISHAPKDTAGGNDTRGGDASGVSTRVTLNDLYKKLRKMGHQQGNVSDSFLRIQARAASISLSGKKKVTDDNELVDGAGVVAMDPKSPAMSLFGSTPRADFHSMYEIVSPLIGEGSTCQVMEVKRKTSLSPDHGTGDGCSMDESSATRGKIQTYACKVVKIATNHNTPSGSSRNTQQATREMVTQELQVMKSLGCHPSLLALHDVIWSGCATQCYLVTEIAKGGTLADVLEKQGRLEEPLARAVMSQVLAAVGFMHSNGLAHLDLKPHNIFLMEPNEFGPGNVKVADFGLSKHLASDSKNFEDNNKECDTEGHTICGSPLYVAPEMLTILPKKYASNGKSLAQYGLKVDMWACGIILFHLLSGKRPFSYATGIHALFRAIKAGEYTREMSSYEWLDVSTDGK